MRAASVVCYSTTTSVVSSFFNFFGNWIVNAELAAIRFLAVGEGVFQRTPSRDDGFDFEERGVKCDMIYVLYGYEQMLWCARDDSWC